MRAEGTDAWKRVERLEAEHPLPEGTEERFAGYGVMAAPFGSGDVLALRRFPASSLGEGYTSVWHRDPQGAWTIWSDHAPLESCPRYFGSAVERSVVAPIEVHWRSPRRLEVRVPSADLRWELELGSTWATRLLNLVSRVMPARLWHSRRMLKWVGRFAGPLLHAGRLGLSGKVPNGQDFLMNPLTVYVLRTSAASLGGRTMERLAPLPKQAHLGDFWVPQRGLFAIGRAFFEPADPRRHHLVLQAG